MTFTLSASHIQALNEACMRVHSGQYDAEPKSYGDLDIQACPGRVEITEYTDTDEMFKALKAEAAKRAQGPVRSSQSPGVGWIGFVPKPTI